MQEVETTISRVAAELDMKVAATEDIQQTLISLKTAGCVQREKLEGMYGALQRVADDFMRADQNISNQAKEIEYLYNHASWIDVFQKIVAPILPLLGIAQVNQCFGISTEGTATIELAMGMIRQFIDTQAARTGKVSAEGEALYNYLQENDTTRLFGQYDFTLHFINDLNWLDGYLFSLRNWKEALASIFLGGGSIDRTAQLFMENPDECKSILRGVIDEICGTEYLDLLSSDGDKAMDILKDLADVNGLDGAADLIEQVNEWIGDAEVADKILKDYSANIAMLESLKDLAPGSSVLSKTVDSLILEYQNQAGAMLFDDLKSKAQEGMIDIVDYALGMNIKSVDKVIQKVLGNAPSLSAINTVVYSNDMRSSAIMAFRKAAETIQSGNFTSADLTAYKNSFNLAKSLTLEQYNGMLKYYKSGTKEARYLKDQIKQLESMSYMDFNYATSYSSFGTGFSSGGGGRGF